MLRDLLVAEIENLEGQLAVLKGLLAEHERVLVDQAQLEHRIKTALNGKAPRRSRGASRPKPQRKAASGRSTTATSRQAAKVAAAVRGEALAQRGAEELGELLARSGPHSQMELVEVSGISKSQISIVLQRAERQGLARRTGEKRGGGRGSPVWAAGPKGGGASPDPGAGAAIAHGIDHGKPTPANLPSVAATPPEPEPPIEDVTIADIQAPPRDESHLDHEIRQVRAEVDDYLTHNGPSTLRAIHEALQLADRGISANAFARLMIGNPWTESWGHDPDANKATWRRIPKPEERDGLTVRQADRTGTVQGRVLEALDHHGALTVEQLASHLVLPRQLVGEACTALAREGTIVKGPGGKYELVASVAA